MKNLKSKHQEITAFCIANADNKIVEKYTKYFKEGYDGYGIDTKLLRSQSAMWMKSWDMTISDYLDLGDLLTSSGKFEEASFNCLFLAAKKDDFSIEAFDRIGNYLENGIQNWGNTDELSMLVLPVFIDNKIIKPEDFNSWTNSNSKWKRRAIPVTFNEVIKKAHDPKPILSVIDKLMEDKEEDVQKGLGTLLREIWKRHPEMAEEFLLKWKDKCGRKVVQYATEKMSKEGKLRFKKIK